MLSISCKVALILACLIFSSCRPRESDLLIYWGHEPSENSPARWNTVAVYSKVLGCSGALIESNVVLTAAHCVSGQDAESMRVHFKANSDDEVRMVSRIETIVPEQDAFFPNMDLAKITFVGLLPEGYMPIGIASLGAETQVLLAGFGVTENACSDSSCRPQLLEGLSEIRSQMDYGHALHLFTTQADPSKSQSAPCFGDSGGPVYVKKNDLWHLVGITNGLSLLHTPLAFSSKTQPECSLGWGLHTDVGAYRSWIAGQIFESEEHPGFASDWEEWLGQRDPRTSSWLTVERILTVLARQDSITAADIPRLLSDPDWSGKAARALSTLNLKSDTKVGQPPITDLAPLAALSGLKTLSLNNIQTKDYSPLSSIPALSRLSIICSPSIPDLSESKFESVLRESLNLTWIGCQAQDLFQVKWQGFIDNLSVSSVTGGSLEGSLGDLQANSIRFSKAAIGSHFQVPRTRSLVLDDVSFNDSQISWAYPGSLEKLSVKNSNLNSLDVLGISARLFPNLIFLDISNTQVSSLEALEGMGELEIIAKNMKGPGTVTCPAGVKSCSFN